MNQKGQNFPGAGEAVQCYLYSDPAPEFKERAFHSSRVFVEGPLTLTPVLSH